MSGRQDSSQRRSERDAAAEYSDSGLAEVNALAEQVLDIAFEIHRKVGPGISESVYEGIFEYELTEAGLYVERQRPISFDYKGLWFENAFYADLVVEKKLVLELKCASEIARAHVKQLLTYLRLMDCRLGLILNFGAPYMKDGIKRVINSIAYEGSAAPSK
jgi:GxxExxY protein